MPLLQKRNLQSSTGLPRAERVLKGVELDKMAKNESFRIGIVVLVLSPIVAWSGLAGSEQGGGNRETLSVGIYDGEISLLVLVAESQGFYAKNGVNVNISGFEAGIIPFNRLIAGEVDVATPADFPFVSRSLHDNTLRILASISSVDVIELLARKDRGIAAIPVSSVRWLETMISDFSFRKLSEKIPVKKSSVNLILLTLCGTRGIKPCMVKSRETAHQLHTLQGQSAQASECRCAVQDSEG